jgi:hypothetical protein|tara:strand:+ start:171 stop:557 length:387 start_codon:yes stop_codon:yes gene_type:complete
MSEQGWHGFDRGYVEMSAPHVTIFRKDKRDKAMKVYINHAIRKMLKLARPTHIVFGQFRDSPSFMLQIVEREGNDTAILSRGGITLRKRAREAVEKHLDGLGNVRVPATIDKGNIMFDVRDAVAVDSG